MAVLLSIGPAHAEGELERRILNQAMTHTRISGGDPVAVHWSHLQGWMLSRSANDAALGEFRQAVAECVQNGGLATPIPLSEWPDRIDGLREEHYATANYDITYFYGWRYGFDAAHCSVPGITHPIAILRSAVGQCHIDFDAKTASGQCDINKHRRARSEVQTLPAGPLPRSFGAMVPRDLGMVESIVGLQCKVFEHLGRRLCVSDAGAFRTFDMAPGRRFSLLLEEIDPTGSVRRAVEAHLDATVGSNVFTPYLQAGFRITESDE